MQTEQPSTRPRSLGRLSEAEGLIDLITATASRLGLRPSLRRRVARRALALAWPLEPTPETAWRRDLAIGQALRLMGRYQQAVGPLWSTVRRNPESSQGWIALGWCLKRLGKIDRAAAVLAKATTAIPDDPTLHYNFACYLSLLGQAEFAISELLWALDLNPDYRRRLAKERDFDSLRGMPAFQSIC